MKWHGNPGERNYQITLQKRAVTTDPDYNADIVDWPPDGGTETTHWVAVKEDQGVEGLEGGQIVSSGRTFFRGLYQEFKDVTAKDYRIVWDGQIYDIVSKPVRLGFNNWIEIKTEHRDNE